MARLWPQALALSSLLFLAALEVSVFGYLPGITDPDALPDGVWMILLASLVLLNVAFAGALARGVRACVRPRARAILCL